jgi:glycosyltransferase involved in cell wall biosynthesis
MNSRRLSLWFIAAVTRESPGGVLRNTQALAMGLGDAGHTVDLFLANTGENVFAFGIRIWMRFLRGPRPDIIIARSFDGFFCSLYIRLLRLPTRVILHNHGWEERSYSIERSIRAHNHLPPRTSPRALAVRFPLVRLSLAMSNACICGTAGEIRWARTTYRFRGHVLYIPNGVNASSPTLHTDPASLRFLTVGPHTWKKNLYHAVDIVRNLHTMGLSAHLTLVGCGTCGLSDSAFGEGLAQGWLTIVPSTAFESMTHFYTSNPFLIAPSIYEGGHPLTILEAMSHGCIVFASAISSHKEIIRNGINGYFLHGQAQEDATLIADKRSTFDVRTKAAQTAQRHRWSRQAQRLEKALRTV